MLPRSGGFFKLRPLDLDLGDMLVQTVAVALGVILGFAATAWNERAHQRALLHETVGNIVAEIRSNQTGMRAVMAEHAKAAETLRRLVARSARAESISSADAGAALRSVAPFRENVPLAIAWQIAQNDQGLTLLPYQDRYDLAGVYQVQASYSQQEERLENSILTLAQPPNGNYFFMVLDLTNQMSSISLMEHRLDAYYTQALTRAKSEFQAQ